MSEKIALKDLLKNATPIALVGSFIVALLVAIPLGLVSIDNNWISSISHIQL